MGIVSVVCHSSDRHTVQYYTPSTYGSRRLESSRVGSKSTPGRMNSVNVRCDSPQAYFARRRENEDQTKPGGDCQGQSIVCATLPDGPSAVG